MELHDFTHLVKYLHPGAQLQGIKTIKKDGGWALLLSFFPAPKSLLFCRDSQQNQLVILDVKQPYSNAPCPLQLYLKAHFSNQRIAAVEAVGAHQLRMEFLPSSSVLNLIYAKGGILEASMQVAGRKEYLQSLTLGIFGEETLGNFPGDKTEPNSSAKGIAVAAKTRADSKQFRLLENITADISAAENWIEKFSPICKLLEINPSAWSEKEKWPIVQKQLLEVEIQSGRLPPWGAEHIGKAQKILFQLRRRMKAKIDGGKKRLVLVSQQKSSAKIPQAIGRELPSLVKPNVESTKTAIPKRKPGIWVSLREPGLWARVGRSSQENAELFRQSKDRDMWFHVRGYSGGHIWIPRGQPDFGAKEEPSEFLLSLGCQLAIFNSKLKGIKEGVVDYTERRNLKNLKGSPPGTLKILRSKTRMTRLDPEFEKKLKGK